MSRRTLLWRALVAAALALIVNVALAASSRRSDVVAVTLIVVSLVALAGAVADATVSFSPAWWRSAQRVEAKSPPTEATLARYERAIERHLVSRELDTDLHQRLLALAERRLAQVYGLSRDTHSEGEVRERLGPELVALRDQPPRRLTPAKINRIIDRIEEL